MKIDGFLKVPDVPGPSGREGHKEEIEIHGVEFKMTAPYDSNTLSRRGRVALDMITFIKHYDMASPLLKQSCFKNKLFGEVKFSARRTIEEASKDYLVITLTDASIMKYELQQSESEPDLIEEKVGFAYKTIEFKYNDKETAKMDISVGL